MQLHLFLSVFPLNPLFFCQHDSTTQKGEKDVFVPSPLIVSRRLFARWHHKRALSHSQSLSVSTVRISMNSSSTAKKQKIAI